jgi:hypothetical protein
MAFFKVERAILPRLLHAFEAFEGSLGQAKPCARNNLGAVASLPLLRAASPLKPRSAEHPAGNIAASPRSTPGRGTAAPVLHFSLEHGAVAYRSPGRRQRASFSPPPT